MPVLTRDPDDAEVSIETPIITTVHGTMAPTEPGHREWAHVRSLCDGHPRALAEIAAKMKLPVGVVRVIVQDLLRQGHVTMGRTMHDADPRRVELMEHVLSGIRRL